MRTLFHLIRHGAYPLLNQALGGRDDHALSSEGRAQAERIAGRLSERPIAAVISSPVQRARETAETIGESLSLDVQLDPAFTEIDFAGWSGNRFEDLGGEPAWHAWNTFRGTAGVPGGETMLAVQARALAGLLRLAAEHPDAELALVSHADVIRPVLAHFLGSPLDLMRRIEIGPGSISQLALYREDAKILAINLPP
jgi:broad specificity phosphatase PhoE